MARADATVQRLHVAADLTANALIEMDAKQAHYLRNVLRLEAGAPLLVFNGRDGEWRGALQEVGKKRVVLRLDRQTRPQDVGGDIWLMVAPVKKTGSIIWRKKRLKWVSGASCRSSPNARKAQKAG